ncbi:MAG TPA: cytochrome c [Roseiflexaceae bacterium]|nr:cytochrome c [Roseiflexaceae bacterium]
MLHTFHRRTRHVTLTRLVRVGWVAAMLLFTAACHLEMYDQPYNRPLSASDFYKDGASARPLVENTVARGQLRTDEASTGRAGGAPDGAYLTEIPIPVTPELIARGRERWGIYCAVCHGAAGDGRGSVVGPQLNPRPTSMYDQRVMALPVGSYYDTIVNGRGAMFQYGSRVQSIEDRWAIIAYIREMQKNPPQ